VEESAELKVCCVLTPNPCAMFGHIGLNKRVSDPGFYGQTACVLHNLGYHSGGNQVVENYRGVLTGLFGPSDLANRDHGGNSRRRDGVTAFVYYETTIGVAIEG